MAMFSEANMDAVGITDNQSKIRYLKRFTILDREIDRKIAENAEWRAKLEKVTAIYSSEPKGGGSIYGKTEAIVARIVDLEAEINADIDRLLDLRQEIERIINTVEDNRERLLLRYRYIDGRTFEWIAAEMNYHWRWVHKLHVRALTKIEIGQ